MSWDKTGHIISSLYQGVAYAGRVTSSRRKNTGDIHHVIELFEPIYVNKKKYESIVVDDLITITPESLKMSA